MEKTCLADSARKNERFFALCRQMDRLIFCATKKEGLQKQDYRCAPSHESQQAPIEYIVDTPILDS